MPLSAVSLDKDILLHTSSLSQAICWQNKLCSFSSLSYLLTGSGMVAGFTAVADHVFAVITALANWLFGMATELIGNIITSPPYSVGCQFFLSCWLALWHIPISGQWIGNCIGWLVDWIFACLINWLDWSSLQLTDGVNSFLSGLLTRIRHFGSVVKKSAICIATKLFMHSYIQSVSKSAVQSFSCTLR